MSPVLFTTLLMIETVAVESSSLAKVAYHHPWAILQVEFHDGSVYHYLGVPIQTYQELLGSDSKGTYFNHHIRNLFPHAVLGAAAPIAPG
jgi:KTSC domain